ncbi:MAG: carboxypeptidase-like regulatory domain-containing protein [Cytophagaceae bacterium]|nr:carboxypeptidase-like regulatory domain-containing protein [Cytophagaceae bacterium]
MALPNRAGSGLTLFFLMISSVAWAQGLGQVSGRVVSATTRQPIAGALVGLPAKGLATLTNAEGFFTYKYPNVSQQETLTITAPGYRDLTKKAVEAIKDTLFLLDSAKQVVLDSSKLMIHSARKLVENALLKVRDNYPSSVFTMNGFYRETLTRDGATARLSEAVLKVEHNPGHAAEELMPEKVKILKARKYENPALTVDLESFSFGNGAALVTHSMEMGIPEYLDGKNLDDYRFRLDSALGSYSNRALWQIHFSPSSKRVKAAREGTIWLDTLTLAFVKIDYEFTPEGREDVLKSTMKSVFGNVFGGSRTTVQRVHGYYAYRLFNGKWYLNDSGLELAADFQKKETKTNAAIRLHFVSTEIFPRVNVPLRENEAMQSTNNFPKGGRYDDGFWAQYNFVKATAGERMK